MTNIIPMYLEPDLPFSAGNGIMLQYMSKALGGNGSGTLHAGLVGKEMPIYRYIGDVNAISTYDMDFFLPLIDRGAVPRFFSFHSQEDIEAIAAKAKETSIKVYDYDIQVHARGSHATYSPQPALVNGKFDMALPTTDHTESYLILKKDGTYENLIPHSKMLGWNVATITVATHGNVPFTVDMASNDRPVVGDGSDRTLARALPTWDDLIGVRIIEVIKNEILSLFKNKTLPENAVQTDKGIEFTELFSGRGTILSNATLDGWQIVGGTPQNGTGWRANLVNGDIVVTFTGDVYDAQMTVQLQNIQLRTAEIKEIEITFSGERETLRDIAGCNALYAMLILLAVFPIFMRRK